MSSSVRREVLGVAVDNLTLRETVEQVAEFVRQREPRQHVVVNADKVVKANKDPHLARIIAECDLINADGMPVVWASRLLGRPLKERVTGIDLFYALLQKANHAHWRVFFLGAQPTVLDEVVRRTRAGYPGIVIAGARDGYWSVEEERGVAEQIALARPDLLFVAISSPKKETFLAEYRSLMKVPFAMGVGGTFDVMAGMTQRAPRWMQKTGFEWFYRFLQEPRRLFRRYFIDDMAFFLMLAKAVWLRRSDAR